jgi:hypothetical protein
MRPVRWKTTVRPQVPCRNCLAASVRPANSCKHRYSRPRSFKCRLTVTGHAMCVPYWRASAWRMGAVSVIFALRPLTRAATSLSVGTTTDLPFTRLNSGSAPVMRSVPFPMPKITLPRAPGQMFSAPIPRPCLSRPFLLYPPCSHFIAETEQSPGCIGLPWRSNLMS